MAEKIIRVITKEEVETLQETSYKMVGMKELMDDPTVSEKRAKMYTEMYLEKYAAYNAAWDKILSDNFKDVDLNLYTWSCQFGPCEVILEPKV